jgi:hypothetical protein
LPELLTRLSELLPERVIVRPLAIVAQVGEFQHPLIQRLRADREWQVAVFALPLLEYALREEIEARGCDWRLYSLPGHGPAKYRVREACAEVQHEHQAFAPTPAHALAAALLKALEGLPK